MCLDLLLKTATLDPALLQFAWKNQVAEIIADSINSADKIHSWTVQKFSEMDSIQSGEKLTVLLRQGAPNVLYLQIETRVPDDIIGPVGLGKERKRRGKILSRLPFIISERSKEL